VIYRALSAAILIAFSTASVFAGTSFRVSARSQVRIEYSGPDDSEVVRFAAQELGKYTQRLIGHSGTWPVTASARPANIYRVRMSRPNSAAPIDDKISVDPATDEYVIRSESGALTITASNANTLLVAVYVLLEQQGCQWLYPGAGGEFVPTKTLLEIPAGTQRSRAGFTMRGLHPVENLQRYSEQDVRDTIDWMAKNRFNRLVFIYNYGWDRLGKVLREESRKRGIRLVAYLWSFEVFLPLELGKDHPEYFAMHGGHRRVDYNVKRCASSQAAIQTYVHNGLDFFRRNPDIDEWNVIPNDGYHWCQCDSCRKIKPKDQWAAFFVPLVKAAARELPRVRFQNFVYVQRFALPEPIEPYRGPELSHFFDVFSRNKWFALRDASGNDPDRSEATVDVRAASVSRNRYLADRLLEWRRNVNGKIWVFEDLMLHATYSIPIPNLPLIAEDLRAAFDEHVNGYLFESYLQGWNSYAGDLWTLGRLCWNPAQDASELERTFYRSLLGNQAEAVIRFQERFRNAYLPQVRGCGSPLYWMHCVPAAVEEYQAALRSINPNQLHANGKGWLTTQRTVAEFLAEIRRRVRPDAAGRVFASRQPKDVLDLCEQALSTGRSMDGPFIAYAELARLFFEQFGTDSLGFRPLLPREFRPQVRNLYSRQKLWDTLAEWEKAGEFPVNPSEPDSSLKQILQFAIDDARRYWGIGGRTSTGS